MDSAKELEDMVNRALDNDYFHRCLNEYFIRIGISIVRQLELIAEASDVIRNPT